MNRRLLLGVDESTGSLAAVRGLRAAGYEPWLAVSQPNTYAARSRAAAGTVGVPDPKREPERYAEEVARAARRLDVAAVLPATEGTLRALTGREELFDERIVVGTQPLDRLERATDKAALVRLADEAGLVTPQTQVLDSATADDVELPVIVKPTRSVDAAADGSLVTGAAERIGTRQELRRLAADGDGRWLVQPYVEGTLAAVCGVSWEGELVSSLHQVSPRIWPTERGISSYAHTVLPHPERESGIRRLMQLIGWSGIYGAQFILTPGRAYLIDLNPRVYGSTALAIAAGHNLPAMWVDLLLGRRPVVRPYRVGVGYRVEEDDFRALAVEFRGGRRVHALAGALPRRRTVHGIFALRDPLPSLVTAKKLLRR